MISFHLSIVLELIHHRGIPSVGTSLYPYEGRLGSSNKILDRMTFPRTTLPAVARSGILIEFPRITRSSYFTHTCLLTWERSITWVTPVTGVGTSGLIQDLQGLGHPILKSLCRFSCFIYSRIDHLRNTVIPARMPIVIGLSSSLASISCCLSRSASRSRDRSPIFLRLAKRDLAKIAKFQNYATR